jgi:hypothetical protein
MRDIRRGETLRVESATARSDYQVTHLPPDHMTAAQRRCEIASLLASGLVRLRSADRLQPTVTVAQENGFELAFPGHQRVHSHPVNKR